MVPAATPQQKMDNHHHVQSPFHAEPYRLDLPDLAIAPCLNDNDSLYSHHIPLILHFRKS
jgi:hypothetical protein